MFAQPEFISYKSGVFDCLPMLPALNHAVLLIGYDNEGWIIKNSWGTSWGYGGFGKISYEGNCGIGTVVYQFTALSIQKDGILLLLASVLILISLITSL